MKTKKELLKQHEADIQRLKDLCLQVDAALEMKAEKIHWRRLPSYSCVRERSCSFVATWPLQRTPMLVYWHGHEAAEAQAWLKHKAESLHVTEEAIATAGKGNVRFD